MGSSFPGVVRNITHEPLQESPLYLMFTNPKPETRIILRFVRSHRFLPRHSPTFPCVLELSLARCTRRNVEPQLASQQAQTGAYLRGNPPEIRVHAPLHTRQSIFNFIFWIFSCAWAHSFDSAGNINIELVTPSELIWCMKKMSYGGYDGTF